MKKKTKIILVAAIAVAAVVAAVILANYLLSVNRYQDAVAGIAYENTGAAGVPDGVYIGECDVEFVYARVEVAVEDGAITRVDLLEHRHERGAAAETIGREIVAQQRVDVDAVSGATNSSTVIKKAVDNALSAARE